MASTVLFLAAGSGQRMQGSVPDKALTPLAGTPAIRHCLKAFLEAGLGESFLVVYRDPAQRCALESAIKPIFPNPEKILWVRGGHQRQESVWNALLALPAESEYVYIHDVARPCIQPSAIAELRVAVERDGAAVLAHPVTDTIKRIPAGGGLRSIDLEDLDRDRLWAMETPQGFETRKIRAAYQYLSENGLDVTDDAAAAACIGLKTTLIPNRHPNPKLTTTADLACIEQLLNDS
jgi:2-C-methyl-D-erythritol 4-phosphate cytidylyltransferase